MRCFVHLATPLALALTVVTTAAFPHTHHRTCAPAHAAFEDATPTSTCYLHVRPLVPKDMALQAEYLDVLAPVPFNVSSRASLPILVRAYPRATQETPLDIPPCLQPSSCTNRN